MSDGQMNNVDVTLLQRQHIEQSVELQRLKSGGGGGTFDGMQDRVKRLEDRLDKVGDGLAEVRVQLATISERVTHLPSKGFIVSCLVTAVTLLGGIVLMAERIRALLGG